MLHQRLPRRLQAASGPLLANSFSWWGADGLTRSAGFIRAWELTERWALLGALLVTITAAIGAEPQSANPTKIKSLPVPALLEIIQNAAAPSLERQAALKTLFTSTEGARAVLDLASSDALPEELRLSAALACAESPDLETRKLGAAKLPLPKTNDGQPVPPISALVATVGSAAAGEKIFRNTKAPNCIGCHLIGQEGHMVGPPLTVVGDRLTKNQIYEAVLSPSAIIVPGYDFWVVSTKSGAPMTGILMEETPDHLTLKNAKGEFQNIPAAQIVRKTRQRMSLMPEGLSGTMSRQDLVDLVEFLSQQKASP
ncbi:MAG TPA: hypothetical protein VGP72_28210 [Planctomycetota bacterium]|jgi:putative heme-binding domain-containing protein